MEKHFVWDHGGNTVRECMNECFITQLNIIKVLFLFKLYISNSPFFTDEIKIQRSGDLNWSFFELVGPNYEHVMFAKQWADYYKDAKIWTGEIPIGCRPPGYGFPPSSSKSIDDMWDGKLI